MGGVGADINAVEIVEKRADGSVVDDFIVDLPPNQLPETLVTACQSLAGVRVEWIARYPEGGGLQSAGATVSLVDESQSSSTPLPRYSNAPGFTFAGSSHTGVPVLSQQSPSATVQPS